VLYLLEWAVIPFFPGVPTDQLGEDAKAIVAAYTGEAGIVAFGAGWFSFVLLGRVLYAAALRGALRASGHPSTLADFAVAAMAVSVAIEVTSFGLAATAGWLADNGADASAVVALDAAASIVFLLVFAPLGLSVLAASAAMLASGLFRKWLCWLGVLSGTFAIIGGSVEAAATGATGTFHDLGGIPTGIGVLTFWTWMLVTSIILWRNVRSRSVESVVG